MNVVMHVVELEILYSFLFFHSDSSNGILTIAQDHRLFRGKAAWQS